MSDERINLSLLPRMDLFDVEWSAVEAVELVDDRNSEVAVRFLNGSLFTVSVPSELMNGIIRHAENKFIQQDLEREDREHGLY